MSAARLLSVRVQGFKSFADRTTVEFGSGISAVVGPNGSGKSNLADALRWALGEQGRSLRARRAEDVIWAGSERRSAQGMADVVLTIDNSDGLFPVEYAVIELGRRLYRSGENDYLLNQQRVRLKDVVDLLDAGQMADNAFLFIGQGMVDQALSLRPEERRPLFEEVAGIRRHDRRRRRAEEQLDESLANMARVDDILAELRPQARRLAVQAEEAASRRSAGEDLVEAVLADAHRRWHEAAARGREAGTLRGRTRDESDQARRSLADAEARETQIAARLAARSDEEQARRTAHEAAATAWRVVLLRRERVAAEGEALARDRHRLDDERAAVVGDLGTQRRLLATRLAEPDSEVHEALAQAERALDEALVEVEALQSANRGHAAELAAARRAEAARAAELDAARRRAAEAERRLAAERVHESDMATQVAGLEAPANRARAAVEAAIDHERSALAGRQVAQEAAESAEAARAAAVNRAEQRSVALAAQRGRLAVLQGRLEEEERRGIARTARSRGGRRVDDELVVEPSLRAAVEAALAEASRAYLLPRSAIGDLRGERGILMPRDGLPGRTAGEGEAARRLREQVAARGGGTLDQAVRRDPGGGATRILARAVWLPTLEDCLELQSQLPPGWIAVPRAGGAAVDDLRVRLGASGSTVGERAELEALATVVSRLEEAAGNAGREAGSVVDAAARSRDELAAARAEEVAAGSARRQAEDAERLAARQLESAVREHGWLVAQIDRLRAELDRVSASLAEVEQGVGATAAQATRQVDSDDTVGQGSGSATVVGRSAAIAAWQERVSDRRRIRDQLAAQVEAAEAGQRESESVLARAEARAGILEERLMALDAEIERLGRREREVSELREAVGREAASAAAAEAEARREADALREADAQDRGSLAAAEQEIAALRDRLRSAEEQARIAEREGLEAELALESIRDQVIAELLPLGEIALRHLPAPRPSVAGGGASLQPSLRGGGFPVAGPVEAEDDQEPIDDDRRSLLMGSLAVAERGWASEPPGETAPGGSRLAQLRRRFAGLGEGNPYAAEEYEAIRARLDELESQRADLAMAIDRTRQLIDELSRMMADQFRATFAALEVAFDRRFQQLFGGGFARLELTDPADLGATGVEITARPPGKRKQPLAMLSGGERSMTAVALLLAMLEVRPIPFCVLDEVDAALDEANVGRFATALRELARSTQFIVITHNRGTIRAADALYGVTIGDDSVSRVISLRLDDTDGGSGRDASQGRTQAQPAAR